MRTKIAKSIRRKALLLFKRFMGIKMLLFFICLCAFCVFLLRYFYARLRLFLFLFAHVLFMLALRLPFLFAYVLFMLFMLALRLSFLFAHVFSMLFMPKSNFFPLRRFYAHLILFLFLFTYVLFNTVFIFIYLCAFYACEIFFSRYKSSSIPSFTVLLYDCCWAHKYVLLNF